MALWGDTRGLGVLANAICGRCKFRFPYEDLGPDPNAPSLRVCSDCRDQIDPYRLPSPPPDRLTLQYPRPDRNMNSDD